MDADAVRSAFDAIHAQFGQVDILFNNVGQSTHQQAAEFWQSNEELWRFVLTVSLLTAMRCSRPVVLQMRQRRSGKIINISSESAFYGDARLVDYAAAKMGIVGFTRALARELAPFQVNVNAVAPGAIRTRAHDGFHRVIEHPVTSPDVAHYFSFDHEGYHFIALDTLELGKPGGFVDAEQLDWLRDDLHAHRDAPTLVFMHHHPWPLDIEWLDFSICAVVTRSSICAATTARCAG
ncbi:hypothetical protein C2W62_27470 [Candidatus Entotheonella serta]|nr:hypothetical protein C2W62_27470 [Candidatus Entotheonella serta]